MNHRDIVKNSFVMSKCKNMQNVPVYQFLLLCPQLEASAFRVCPSCCLPTQRKHFVPRLQAADVRLLVDTSFQCTYAKRPKLLCSPSYTFLAQIKSYDTSSGSLGILHTYKAYYILTYLTSTYVHCPSQVQRHRGFQICAVLFLLECSVCFKWKRLFLAELMTEYLSFDSFL